MTDYGLTPQQIEIIEALSSGATMTEAATQGGVHRNTIANWRRNNLPFQQAFAHAQYDRALFFRERSEELAGLAAQAVREVLADPKAAPAVRIRAALAILNTINTPPQPKRQVRLDIEKIVISKAPPQVFPDENLGTEPPKMHNSAQSDPPQTIRRDHPKVGRNDICPCGSGQKFKRCCVDKPLAQAA
jgi:transposase-like protein